ncbi:tetratricopeptide repeat protein [Spirulina sp. 06S082]|uniref:tetratricopeptide repeat protein n=1 Tax=Spirulina sp. 06S082 TaxID=3110248 RepID=UPI002B21B59E|nr:tetratricopeptide repeat protein [Spirulina sp. 06S082]MEA5470882.1 tetratricopeptide repeat protein [Spirulina sp. 06S082]
MSWQDLPEKAREVACLLSLFAVASIPWELVQECFEEDEEELEDVRDRILVKLSLLQRLEAGWFQLHPLLQRFMGDKLEESEMAKAEKQKYCRVMVKVAQQMPQTPTLEQVEEFAVFIPHLDAVTQHLCDWIEDDDLIWPFAGIAFYYEGQGLYSQAEPYSKQCLLVVRDRFGEEHLHVATSLNNLALLYGSQGRYEEAEPLYLQALELSQKLLGEEHPDVATSLNNLALLYHSQGRYEKAEPLYLQAVEILMSRLGVEHPHSQTVSLNFWTCLQSAVSAGQRDIFSNHPFTQQLLAQIDAANEKE